MKKIKLTEKEYAAEINKAYLQGYKMGMVDGRHEAISGKNTPRVEREYTEWTPSDGITIKE